jgi:hypothetical protein
MWSSFIVLAESGMTWTPETFYVAATVVQLIVLLIAFRLLQLPSEHNSFINGLFVVVPTNAVAYFLIDAGILGVLATGSLLFILLAAITRGDVLPSIVAWVALIAMYWVLAYFIVPAEEELEIYDIGGLPQVLIEGGLEAQPLEREDIYGEDDED